MDLKLKLIAVLFVFTYVLDASYGDTSGKDDDIADGMLTIEPREMEIMYLLMGYQAYPAQWPDIVEYVKKGFFMFTNETQRVYRTQTNKQLEDRLVELFEMLMSANINSFESTIIRQLLVEVKKEVELEEEMDTAEFITTEVPNDERNQQRTTVMTGKYRTTKKINKKAI